MSPRLLTARWEGGNCASALSWTTGREPAICPSFLGFSRSLNVDHLCDAIWRVLCDEQAALVGNVPTVTQLAKESG